MIWKSLLQKEQKILSIANSKLSGIINYCADGIIILDKDGKY